MSVSALVRSLIATFDWLESTGLPAVRSAVRLVRNCCAIAREKFGQLRLPVLPDFRSQLEKIPFFRCLAWVGGRALDAVIFLGSALLCAWLWLAVWHWY